MQACKELKTIADLNLKIYGHIYEKLVAAALSST